ncbi:MAG: winged helix-turn-helix domain-containing protein [Candidatus Aenigmarchaeota archaeon]
MFDDDKITLDKSAFRALASDTRVSMLKLLLKRRMTLSELSKKLGMSVSTIKEHLESLVSADLIKQIDDGHKWKYYELTKAGREVVQPSDRRIMVLLAISAVAALFGMNGLISKFSPAGGQTFLAKEMVRQPMATGGGAAEILMETAADTAAGAAPELISAAPSIPYFELTLTVVALIVLGTSIGYLYSRRK